VKRDASAHLVPSGRDHSVSVPWLWTAQQRTVLVQHTSHTWRLLPAEHTHVPRAGTLYTIHDRLFDCACKLAAVWGAARVDCSHTRGLLVPMGPYSMDNRMAIRTSEARGTTTGTEPPSARGASALTLTGQSHSVLRGAGAEDSQDFIAGLTLRGCDFAQASACPAKVLCRQRLRPVAQDDHRWRLERGRGTRLLLLGSEAPQPSSRQAAEPARLGLCLVVAVGTPAPSLGLAFKSSLSLLFCGCQSARARLLGGCRSADTEPLGRHAHYSAARPRMPRSERVQPSRNPSQVPTLLP
jgi:hypothetical protein